MTGIDGIRRHSLDQRALDLMAHLEQVGGASATETMHSLGWNRHQFDTALQHARATVCPALNTTIPHPVPDDGYRYRVTGLWLTDDGSPAIEAGTAFALGFIESRLRAVMRDVNIAQANLDPKSVNGRKVNYLSKHLLKMLTTFAEIGTSTPAREQVAS